MNATLAYENLMARARCRVIEGYVERHHVIPKSLGGSDVADNIVSLTAREHFIAHQLLVRMHPQSRALTWAALLMSKRERFNPGQSRKYEYLRRAASESISASQMGEPLVMTEARREAYQKRVGVSLTAEHRQKVSSGNKGKRRSQAVIEKCREIARQRPAPSEETRRKLSASLIGNSRRAGIPNSLEMKRKIMAANLGRRQSQEEKDRRADSIRRISDEAIRGVRRDGADGCFTQEQIAARNGTSKSQVGRILRGEKYAQVA